MSDLLPGSIISQWTPDKIRSAIASANTDIKQALSAGDMDRAWTLISRKVGWRVCAGDIVVRLKNKRMA